MIGEKKDILKVSLKKSRVRWSFGWDWLLILGCVLAPMTGLRVWKVGPGEALCAFWCVIRIKSLLRSRAHLFFQFWVAFFSIMLLGMFYCLVKYPRESVPMQLLTWLYLMVVSISIVSYFSKSNAAYLSKMLMYIAVIGIIWYLFLHTYSQFVSRKFLGATLWYHGVRFTGGATNPHQLAMPMVAFGMVMLSNAFQPGKKIFYRICLLALFGVSVFLLWETDSTTGKVALYSGVFTVLLFFLKKELHVTNSAIIVIVLLLILLGVIFWEKVWAAFQDWLSEDDNGIGRLELIKAYKDTFFKNPFFGLGPGVHGRDGRIEYHNTYLEIMAMSGIAGMIMFIVFSVAVFRICAKDRYSLTTIIAMYMFGLAGFAMRRLVFWVILPLLTVRCSLMNEEERKPEDPEPGGPGETLLKPAVRKVSEKRSKEGNQ